jgi:hypothetical protein
MRSSRAMFLSTTVHLSFVRTPGGGREADFANRRRDDLHEVRALGKHWGPVLRNVSHRHQRFAADSGALMTSPRKFDSQPALEERKCDGEGPARISRSGS